MEPQKRNTKLVGTDIISKQDFLRQVKEKIEAEPILKTIQQKWIVKNLKIVYFLSYILGIFVMCLIMDFPKRNIENNMDIILLVGDYLSFIIPVLIIPMFPILFIYGLFAELFNEKEKTDFAPVIYAMLGMNRIEKDKKIIEKVKDIGLFPGYNYRIDDSFQILRNKYHFFIQEIEIYNNNDETLFWGPVITFPLNFSYRTTILVLDKNISKIPSWLQNYVQKKMKKVTLTNVKFMDKYQVFGSDQNKARLILTPVMMTKLQKLRDVCQSPVNVLFIDDKIILAIDTNTDMFEFFDFEKQRMIEKCENFYDEIATLFEFQELLELK